ncbi:MAG: protein-disulfide reductase DsbD domain-containing protein [Pseudomonadota bacterium]
MLRNFLISLACVLSFVVPVSTPVSAQNLGDIVQVEVLPGWRGANGTHTAALRVTMAEGWKTYWRSPGEAGIPPRFDWRGSRNLIGVEMIWPTPRITVDHGMLTIGYTRELVLPMQVLPKSSGQDVRLKGIIEIGVCREVCIPAELRVNTTLNPGAGQRDPRIAASLANQPYSASEAGVGRVACRVSPTQDGLGLRAEIDMPRLGGQETAIIEVADPMIWVAKPKTTRQGGRLIAQTSLHHVEGRSFALDRKGIRVTVLAGGEAVDIQGCPAG